MASSSSSSQQTYKIIVIKGEENLADPIKFMLLHLNIPHEVEKCTQVQWNNKYQSVVPFGRAPTLLEPIEGKYLIQVKSICRYLARLFAPDLCGSNDWDNLEIDMMADTVTDLYTELAKYLYEPMSEIKTAIYHRLHSVYVPAFVDYISSVIRQNNGFLALSKLTWADIYFYGMQNRIDALLGEEKMIENYSEMIRVLFKFVATLPQIKKYKRLPDEQNPVECLKSCFSSGQD